MYYNDLIKLSKFYESDRKKSYSVRSGGRKIQVVKSMLFEHLYHLKVSPSLLCNLSDRHISAAAWFLRWGLFHHPDELRKSEITTVENSEKSFSLIYNVRVHDLSLLYGMPAKMKHFLPVLQTSLTKKENFTIIATSPEPWIVATCLSYHSSKRCTCSVSKERCELQLFNFHVYRFSWIEIRALLMSC